MAALDLNMNPSLRIQPSSAMLTKLALAGPQLGTPYLVRTFLNGDAPIYAASPSTYAGQMEN